MPKPMTHAQLVDRAEYLAFEAVDGDHPDGIEDRIRYATSAQVYATLAVAQRPACDCAADRAALHGYIQELAGLVATVANGQRARIQTADDDAHQWAAAYVDQEHPWNGEGPEPAIRAAAYMAAGRAYIAAREVS